MTNRTVEVRPHLLATPAAALAGGPRILAISGGRAGVGATTVAMNLATSLASEALRVVLIDGDSCQAEVAAHCGLTAQPNISDVLTGRKNIHEALQRAPAGMQILAGSISAEAAPAISPRMRQRLQRQLLSLRRHADWIIVDAGHQATELMSLLWSLADQVLLVTAPDAAAVMDTYAFVKTLLSNHAMNANLSLAVNLAESAADAADVYRRVDQSCRRFLGISLGFAGFVPPDPSSVSRPDASAGLDSRQTTEPFADAFSRLVHHLTAAPAANAAPRRMAA